MVLPEPDIQRRDRQRSLKDRAVRYAVSSGGMLVLLMLIVLFFYLLYTVLPLFQSPKIAPTTSFELDNDRPAWAVGFGPQQKNLWRLDNTGAVQIIPLSSQPVEITGTVPELINRSISRFLWQRRVVLEDPDTFAKTVGPQPLLALSGKYTGVTLFELKFVPDIVKGSTRNTHDLKPVLHFPYGKAPLILNSRYEALSQLAVARTHNRVAMAGVTTDNHVVTGVLQNGELTTSTVFSAPANINQILISPDARILYLLSGHELSVYDLQRIQPTLRETVDLWRKTAAEQVISEQENVVISFLAGGSSLMVSDSTGNITQWFDVQEKGEFKLKPIRSFKPSQGTQGTVFSEPLRRVFANISDEGVLDLFSLAGSEALLTEQIVGNSGIKNAIFSPSGDVLLTENTKTLNLYHLDNRYPEISLGALWQKVWYENYPEPAYVWQSTSGSDMYQPKLSLIPIILGTLKAALYGMMFAIPLALAGAVYTACFMSAGLRRWVKPMVEMMGAMPTVVIGLLAGLWLAPVIERNLAAILSMPVFAIFMALLTGWISTHWPERWKGERLKVWVNAGGDTIALILTLLIGFWLLFNVMPYVERGMWGSSLSEHLGMKYDRSNGVVIGLAMGFALTPIIFSLAEDALFSVPGSLSQGSYALGASRWQTVWRIVLPSASSGIFAALMIGFGRAMGETMIVLMASGNTPLMDLNLFQGLRALSANIAVELPEAPMGSEHYRVLFLMALVLFLFTFVFNSLAEAVRLRLRARYAAEGSLG